MRTIATPTQLQTMRPTRTRRAVTVLVAVASALAVWAVAVSLLGVDLSIASGHDQPPMLIGFGAVAATSLAASLAGWASLAVLERFNDRARTIWTTTAIVVLLVSLAPVAAVDTSGAATATLALLHLIVATVLILGLTRPLTGTRHGGRS